MPTARKTERPCRRCGDGPVWKYVKLEPGVEKHHLECDGCNFEWTERESRDDPEVYP